MRLCALVSALLFLAACGSEKEKRVSKLPAGLIAGHSQGEISRLGPIQIVFQRPVPSANSAAAAAKLSPAHGGIWELKEERILHFSPTRPLEAGTSYSVQVELGKLFPALGENDLLEFQVSTPRRSFSIQLGPLTQQSEGDPRWQHMEGVLESADWEEPALVESLLAATYADFQPKIGWTHSPDGRFHRFLVQNLERRAKAQDLIIQWDASALGLDFKGEERRILAGIDSFELLYVAAMQEAEPHVLIGFSDVLDRDQDLTGLLHADRPLRLTIEGNLVRVYCADSNFGETFSLTIEPGVRNAAGRSLGSRISRQLSFQQSKPALRLVGKGTILPENGHILFPFESVSLSAVDVQVIKILEHNLHQFFQVNQIDQNVELYRVGEVVASRTLQLDPSGKRDLRHWSRHNFDLGELIQKDPGALYRVEIGFRPAHSLYTCPAETQLPDRTMLVPPTFEEESNWDYWFEGYRWDRREDPCHVSYYRRDHVVARNVYVSDLGLVAKLGRDERLQVAASHLGSTEPLAGVYLEVLDYTRRVVGTGSTDGLGMAAIELSGKPFLLHARKGSSSGWLKLLEGMSNSLSRFEVGGEPVRKGLNGFLYGERGVWRPGDELFLTFLLHDPQNTLPADHPVELELTNPQGVVVDRQVSSEGLDGFYPFRVQSQESWETGSYAARVRVGGSQFERLLRIETIVPNRLRIQFQTESERLLAGGSTKASIAAQWLHGATARNLKTDVALKLSKMAKPFSAMEGYTFMDLTRTLEFDPVPLFAGTLDENGQLAFQLDFPAVDEAPGMLDATFTCRVHEAGGGFSIDQFSLPYHPYPAYVGLKTPRGDQARGMLLTDVDHPVELVTVDPSGKPVARKGIKVELFQIDWQWWIESGETGQQFQQAQLSRVLDTRFVDTDEKGFASYPLRRNYPEWGRYLLLATDAEGHRSSTTVFIDWPGWAGRGQEDNPGGEAMLQFSTDAERYELGDTVTLNIPTGQAGRALVSLESPERVLSRHWVDARFGTTRFSFKATAEMTPNIFAHVTLLQPHQNTANDRPIRLYGVVPISISDPASHLQPLLTLPEEFRPGSSAKIAIAEAEGRPMTYTIAVVDEGLLGLTRFKTPDPFRHFNATQALAVKTWDVYSQVMGAMDGDLTPLLSIGGDESGLGDSPPKPNRFPPLVRFLGPFTLAAGKKASHELQLPTTLGAVRTMVVAAHQGTFGHAEQSTPIRQPLMVLAALPRQLAPGERFELPCTVFVGSAPAHGKVHLELKSSSGLTLSGPASLELSCPDLGEYDGIFRLEAGREPGFQHLELRARAEGEPALWQVDIEIRHPNPEAHALTQVLLESGQSWSDAVQPFGMAGTNHGTLELSILPPLNLERRLDQLVQYPHGCLEQTTSAAFPQLFLSNLMELSAPRMEQVRAHVAATFAKYTSFQRSDGTFAYWPGQSGEGNLWSDCYAGHFLVEARDLGYALPSGMLEKWLGAQDRLANAWVSTQNDDLVQAYRLFVLARAGMPAIGAMNRLRDRNGGHPLTPWFLAASFDLAGRGEMAGRLTASASLVPKVYREQSQTFGSDLRDAAAILLCQVLMKQTERGRDLIQSISNRLTGEEWLSTQELGFSLLAMSLLARGASGSLKAMVTLGGEAPRQIDQARALALLDYRSDEPFYRLAVQNKGSGMLFVHNTLAGIPELGKEQAYARGLHLAVSHVDAQGAALDFTSLRQGADVWIKVLVANRSPNGVARNIALTLAVPSGWQLANPRMAAPDSTVMRAPQGVAYQDFRDGSVKSYFDLPAQQSIELRFLANASFRGRFYYPPLHVGTMYDPALEAQNQGAWVEVLGGKP